MEATTMGHAAVFFFLAAASIAFFSFLVASHWIDARTEERKARERFALLKKLADQPPESVSRLLDLVREDDAREARREARKREDARREELKGGTIVVAVGIGLSIMLAKIIPIRPLWTIGLMLIGVGAVIFAFAYFSGRRQQD
jgi:hypothetical protein